jgi:hypothetical protein
MANRRDEEPKTWFRSERVFRVDGDWFIHTREGIAVGPYSDKFAADVDAEVLKSLLVGVDVDEATKIIQSFMHGDCHNLAGERKAGASASDIDPEAVASLLEEEEYDFDSIRQLS